MLRPVVFMAALIAIGSPVAAGGPPRPDVSSAIELSPGDVAPAFALRGSDGRTYRLSDYRGKQAVVLAWFAKAFTGG